MTNNEMLTSRSNPLVKEFRALSKSKTRKQTGLFLVEGIHHVGAAVEADWDVDAILYAPDLLTSEYARDLVQDSAKKGIRCQSASADIFRSLAGKENPQGILAAVQQRETTLADLAGCQHIAAVIAPQDAGNVGTILRTLDAVGADALVLLEGGVDIYHPKVVRASMGALFWKPVVRTAYADLLAWTKKNGLQLLGTSAHGTSDLASLGLAEKGWVLLLGSEQKGLSDEQAAACDVLLSLPMRGKGTSLNLGVAAGVFLYGLMQKMPRG